ncbi:MAG: TerB family tellurite resistance protein [Panacagrimonas sp.]
MWKRWLSRLDSPSVEAHPPRDIATAVLLLECARADFEHSDAEFCEVRRLLADKFGLVSAELDRLIGDAGSEAREAVSLHGPVARLNAELSQQDKRELMSWLWRVAGADGHIDAHEEHLLRKLADLLHLSHADYIRTKLEVQEKA